MKLLNRDIEIIYTTYLIKSSELRIKKPKQKTKQKKQKQISKGSALHWLQITEFKRQWHKTSITAPLLQVIGHIFS